MSDGERCGAKHPILRSPCIGPVGHEEEWCFTAAGESFHGKRDPVGPSWLATKNRQIRRGQAGALRARTTRKPPRRRRTGG